MSVRRKVIAGWAAAMVLSGTAAGSADAQRNHPYGSRIEGKTEAERAMGKCVRAVIGGTILGAIVGRVISRKGAGDGALIGAGAGGVACLVIMAVADKKDKERLRAVQLQALNAGAIRYASWRTEKGETATARVTASPLHAVSAENTGEVLQCTTMQTAVSASARNTEYKDLTCLVGDTWVTGDKLKPYGLSRDTA